MELRTLTYVDAVARLGGFTRAARELHVAQPAVSIGIAALERELGTRIFVRSSRGAVPTESGERVVERARRILAEVAAMRADVAAFDALLTGTLHVGATPLLSGVDLPRALATFRRAHPGVTIRTGTDLIAPLLADLEAGRLDVVVGPADRATRDRFRVDVLAEEDLVLCCPPDLPRVPTDLADAAAHEFVCLPRGSGLRGMLERAAATGGVTAAVTTEVAAPAQIREYVAAGLGVALLARSAATGPGPTVTVVELDGLPAHPPLAAIRARHAAAPAATALVGVLRALRDAEPDQP